MGITLSAAEALEKLRAEKESLTQGACESLLELIVKSNDLRFTMWAYELDWLPKELRSVLVNKLAAETSLGMPRREPLVDDKGTPRAESVLTGTSPHGGKTIVVAVADLPEGSQPLSVRSHIARGPDGQDAYACFVHKH